MKHYYIERKGNRGVICQVITDEKIYTLKHVVVHSPDGFEIGYLGSGSADLALSILADHLGESEEFIRNGERFVPCSFCGNLGDGCETCGFLGGHIEQSEVWLWHQYFKSYFLSNPDRKDLLSIRETEVQIWIEHVRSGGITK